MLLLFLLQSTAPVATPLPPPQTGMISVGDYPREALSKHWEGEVQYDLTVGTKGRPIACHVVQSSGHKVIDDATCNILISRARFKPALDAAGNPIESHWPGHINWRLAH
jgi:protein TonB